MTSVATRYTTRNPRPISQELADELAFRLMRTTERRRNGCWVRTTIVNPKTGYSSITKTVRGEKSHYLAHRVMYVHYNGPIPAGLTIDHLCENPPCCNPAHLRAVTHAANVLRSTRNPFAIHAQQTHCANGHELPERTLTTSAKRTCRQCKSEGRARRRKARAGNLPPGDPRHGTRAGYGYWACLCDECKAWQRADYLAKKVAA